MSDKRLKDPVYGYITLDESTAYTIVDSPAFQRLRHIRQTSYTPLYSAALHNRFIHSLGVYHLGKIALASIQKSVELNSELQSLWKVEWGSTFTKACLMHDIGHSPFSHSGEIFYLEKNGDDPTDPLYCKLKDTVHSQTFSQDFDFYIQQKKAPAPHEVMSALVGVTTFSDAVGDKELFVRCITGCLYRKNDSVNQVKNGLIQLLNSSCIDVDKIDYLLRDAFVTGFDTISIDYERLLKSLELKKTDGIINLVFNKSALSVLENVIYAHDSERKWIQNHPVVLYESFILQFSIKLVQQYYKENGINIFSEKALSEQGVSENNEHISLLCDDDIIYTMKNKIFSPIAKEYFNRQQRRHAVWKSEAEYHIIFDEGKSRGWLDKFENCLRFVEKFLQEECTVPVLNDDSAEQCQTMLKKVNEQTDLKEEDKKTFLIRYTTICETITYFKTVSSKIGIPFDFVIIKAKRFASGFAKDALENQLVDFSNLSKPHKLREIRMLLQADIPEDKEFFYLYYKRNNNKSIGLKEFAGEIRKTIPDDDL